MGPQNQKVYYLFNNPPKYLNNNNNNSKHCFVLVVWVYVKKRTLEFGIYFHFKNKKVNFFSFKL